MVDLILTRVCASGRHNQISVIGEFEYLVNRVYWMQFGRSDNVRSWDSSPIPD